MRIDIEEGNYVKIANNESVGKFLRGRYMELASPLNNIQVDDGDDCISGDVLFYSDNRIFISMEGYNLKKISDNEYSNVSEVFKNREKYKEFFYLGEEIVHKANSIDTFIYHITDEIVNTLKISDETELIEILMDWLYYNNIDESDFSDEILELETMLSDLEISCNELTNLENKHINL